MLLVESLTLYKNTSGCYQRAPLSGRSFFAEYLYRAFHSPCTPRGGGSPSLCRRGTRGLAHGESEQLARGPEQSRSGPDSIVSFCAWAHGTLPRPEACPRPSQGDPGSWTHGAVFVQLFSRWLSVGGVVSTRLVVVFVLDCQIPRPSVLCLKGSLIHPVTQK